MISRTISKAGPLCLLLLFTLIISSCSSYKAPSSPPEDPSWIRTPPVEVGYLYGIGVDPDPAQAKQKAIINVGQQFSSRIESTVETKRLSSGTVARRIVATVNEQLCDTSVNGAKFADQYTDDRGRTWILAQAPLDCVMDVTEGILLSYLIEEKSQAPLQLQIQEALHEVQTSLEDSALPYYEGRADGIVKVSPGTIEIDGDISDWIIPPIAVDAVNDTPMGNRDITKVYLASDDTYLYLRVDFREGRPAATSTDLTYDLTFTLDMIHYELWCLKNGHTPTVNSSNGGPNWSQQTQGCRVRTDEGHLEARFPWSTIAPSGGPIRLYGVKYRVRDGGNYKDSLDLQPIEM